MPICIIELAQIIDEKCSSNIELLTLSMNQHDPRIQIRNHAPLIVHQ